MEYILILTTVNNSNEAKNLASALLNGGLAGCVNIINSIDSLYVWEGKVISDREFLLLIKTKKELFKDVEAEIKKLHSYEIPEIISLEINEGSKEFLNWLNSSVKKI